MRASGTAAAALALVAWGGIAQAGSKARPPRGDLGTFFGADNYPVEAIRRGEQGRVLALLQVDPAGRVVSCRVEETSGSGALDRATCEIALRDVTFEPALDRKGRETASTYKLPVRWILPQDPQEVPPELMSTSSTTTLSIDEGGRVVGCRTEMSAPQVWDVDPCTEFPVDKQTTMLVRRDGRPRSATIVRRISQEITPDP